MLVVQFLKSDFTDLRLYIAIEKIDDERPISKDLNNYIIQERAMATSHECTKNGCEAIQDLDGYAIAIIEIKNSQWKICCSDCGDMRQP